jgi:hypothetical protein
MKWLKETWFLLALIALALCAIPGVILVILRLLELDGEINAWLLNFNISYELRLSPWIALILLLLPIVLIILYFLKLKRKPIQVPSTFLWKKSIEDLHVNSLFQWLRNNVLLLLQLIVLLFLIYSVLGIRFHGATEISRHFILMIDNSASMSAKDVSPTRLDWAKQEAIKEIDAVGHHDYGMVIVFNSKATTLQTYTNDKEKLREAVRSIMQTQRPTRIEEALALAESLANPVRSTEDLAVQPVDVADDQKRTFVQARGISTVVHVYSDGRYAKLSETALAALSLRKADDDKSGGLNLRYHMAGKYEVDKAGDTNNLAVVDLNVMRKPMEKKKGAIPIPKLLTHVRVANFRAQKAIVKLKLDVYVDGQLTHPLLQSFEVAERKYTAAKEEKDEVDEPGETSWPFELPFIDPSKNIVLHAHLDKTGDDFPLDDEAWLAVGTMRKAKVLIIGPANQVLEAFFDQDGTKKIAASERMPAAELKEESYRKKARSGDYDLVIFDRCAPADESDMPMSNTFFIDRPPPPWTRGDKMLKNPLMMPSKQQHPLLRFLTTIWEVRTSEAWLFDVSKNLDPKVAELTQLPDGDPNKRALPSITRIIETSNQNPLIFALARGPHTDLVQTFPLINDKDDLVTDWPLQASFPLFFRNVLYILGNVDDSVRAVSVSAGEAVVLRPEAGFNKLVVTTPPPAKDKITEEKRRDRNEIVFTKTDKLGIYTYVVDSKGEDDAQPRRAFAVNLLDVNESNIEPRPTIRIGNERYATGEEKQQTREIWKWILLLAVALLATEWYIYHRRIAV